ncbi:WhiB family transcriptional regulator [Streptomyces cocklensis]|nr:WhiB family transcriptional regulator [Actinacidiphila cocklensis]
MSSSTFFSPPGERGRARREREERARRVCGRCAVADICAATALRHGEPYGVWGGLSDSQRRRLSRGAEDAAGQQDTPAR